MTDAIARRFVVLLLASSIACIGPVQAAVNPVPVLAIKLDQAMVTVHTNESAQSTVVINGNCTVDKLPIERATVTLTSSTDVGWVSQISPTTMVFTSTAPQSFTCTVVVPQGTPNMTATLVVDGRAVAGGLQSSAETKAVITNIGPLPYVPPANQTTNNTGVTKPSAGSNQTVVQPGLTTTYGPAGLLGYSYEQWAGIGAVVAVVLVAVVIVVRVRNRGKAALEVESLEEA